MLPPASLLKYSSGELKSVPDDGWDMACKGRRVRRDECWCRIFAMCLERSSRSVEGDKRGSAVGVTGSGFRIEGVDGSGGSGGMAGSELKVGTVGDERVIALSL